MTVESYLAEIVTLLNGERNAHVDADSWLARVTERFHDSPLDTPTLVELAGDAGVHFTTLARGFRQRIGCTPGEYLRGIRLTLASQRLAAGDETVGRIAYVYGFADQSHFGRWFRASFGVTPGEYRRRFRSG